MRLYPQDCFSLPWATDARVDYSPQSVGYDERQQTGSQSLLDNRKAPALLCCWISR